MGWCNLSLRPLFAAGKNGPKPSRQLLKASRNKRRRWWTPLQTPWTWRSTWPNPDTKWYWCIFTVLRISFSVIPTNVPLTSLISVNNRSHVCIPPCIPIWSWLFPPQPALSCSLLIFHPLSHLLYQTSSMGGLAPDSMSTPPHTCHDIKVQGHGIGCPSCHHFQHSLQSWGQRLTETQPHISQTIRRVEIAFWVKWCLKCSSGVVSGIMCPG